MAHTVLANELLNVLDSCTLSSESKNSIIVDYIDRIYRSGITIGKVLILEELKKLPENKDANSEVPLVDFKAKLSKEIYIEGQELLILEIPQPLRSNGQGDWADLMKQIQKAIRLQETEECNSDSNYFS